MKAVIRIRNRSNDRQGSALVEFAILLPFLSFLILSLVEFGMLMQDYMHAVNIVRDASRQAAQIANHEQNVTCEFRAGVPCSQTNAAIPHLRAWYLLSAMAPNIQMLDDSNGTPVYTGRTVSHLTVDDPTTPGPRHQTVRFALEGMYVTTTNIEIPINIEAVAGYRIFFTDPSNPPPGGPGWTTRYEDLREDITEFVQFWDVNYGP